MLELAIIQYAGRVNIVLLLRQSLAVWLLQKECHLNSWSIQMGCIKDSNFVCLVTQFYKWTEISNLWIDIFDLTIMVIFFSFIWTFSKPPQSCCCQVQKNGNFKIWDFSLLIERVLSSVYDPNLMSVLCQIDLL